MLSLQKWMRYANALAIDWKEALEGGQDVEYLKEVCEAVAVAARARPLEMEEIAKVIGNFLRQAPMRPDYPYREPDTLHEILSERPKSPAPSLPGMAVGELYLKKLEGAWIGRIAGCLLGKPAEGLKRVQIERVCKELGLKRLDRYLPRKGMPENFGEAIGCDPEWFENRFWIDRLEQAAPVDDDTNYTVFALKLLETYGMDFQPDDVLEGWLSNMPMFSTCTAERVAYRNAASGMRAPQTAHFENPYRERIGAQIRGDFFGYICPGNPEKAAELAFRDASISHVKNGIYGEMFVAAAHAAAGVSGDVEEVIRAGLLQIPEKSRFARDVETVLRWQREGLTALEVIDGIHRQYNEYDAHEWCHTNANAMIVVMALLYGEKDLGKTICLAVEAAFDTDCNGATAGSIIGMMAGREQIDPYWYETFHSRLFTTIIGYTDVTVEELARKTLQLIK